VFIEDSSIRARADLSRGEQRLKKENLLKVTASPMTNKPGRELPTSLGGSATSPWPGHRAGQAETRQKHGPSGKVSSQKFKIRPGEGYQRKKKRKILLLNWSTQHLVGIGVHNPRGEREQGGRGGFGKADDLAGRREAAN